MIDQIGKMKRIKEAVEVLEQFINENSFVFSNPTEGQSKVESIAWDNETQKVEVQKESQEE